MRHIDVQNSLTDYLEGELDLEFRAKVDEHLDACDACSDELQDLRHAVFLLRRLPTPEPPPTLVSDVMRRIEDGEAAPGFASYFRRAWAGLLVALEPPRLTAPALGLAAGLAIVLAMGDTGFSFKEFGSETRQVTSVARTAPPAARVSPRAPAINHNQWNARRQVMAARSGERLDLRGSTAPAPPMSSVN
ncbi:zf-HC2 domain-containing protein, partial [Myxococcota bacterium]|nr:zf-HC2 domain-containing protein [Myxococcota bacterium]